MTVSKIAAERMDKIFAGIIIILAIICWIFGS